MASGSFSLPPYLVPNNFVDVYDYKQEMWRAALIDRIEPNGDLFLVYDDSTERLKPTSNRLNPFRLRTSNLPIHAIPQAWLSLPPPPYSCFPQLSYEDFATQLQAYEFVQEVRGQLFFQGQELGRKASLSAEEQRSIIDVGDKVNTLMTLWLTSGDWVIPRLNSQSAASFLSDPQAAFASMWPELFSLFTLLLRCPASLSSALRDILPDSPAQTAQEYFYSHFGLRDQFFHLALTFLTSYKQGDPATRLPLGLWQRLPVWEVCELFRLTEVNLKFMQALRTRLACLSALDHSVCSKPAFDSFLQFFFSQSQVDSTCRERDSLLVLNLPLQLINSGSVSARAEGVGVLARLIGESKEGRGEFEDYIFATFAVKHSLATQLLTDRPSAQVLKRAPPIFLELAKFQHLDLPILSILTDTLYCENYDVELRDAVFAILVAVSEQLPIPLLKEIQRDMESKPSHLDEKWVTQAGTWMKSAGRVLERHPEVIETFFLKDFLADVLRAEAASHVAEAKKAVLVESLVQPGYRKVVNSVLATASDDVLTAGSRAISIISDLIRRLSPAEASDFLRKYAAKREKQGNQPFSLLKVVTRKAVLMDRSEKELREELGLVDGVVGVGERLEVEDLKVMMEYFLQGGIEKKAFFQWLVSTPSLSVDLSDFLFEMMQKTFSLPTLATYPLPVFSSYLHFFFSHNTRLGRILTEPRGLIIQRNSVRLPGFAVICQFAIYTQSSDVRSLATTTITSLFTCLAPHVAAKSLKSFLRSVRDELAAIRDQEAAQRLISLLCEYVSRLEEITTSESCSPGQLEVYYIFPEDDGWRKDYLPETATYQDLRRDIAKVWPANPAEVCCSYNANSYTFLHDKFRLSELGHPLHFKVTKISEQRYTFVPVSVGLGSDLQLLDLLVARLEGESDASRQAALWRVISKFADNKTVKMRLLEGGSSFRKMLGGSFFEQLFCLLAVSLSANCHQLSAFLQQRDQYALFDTMQRNATNQGGLFEFLAAFDSKLAMQYAVLMILAVSELKAAHPEDCSQAFVTFLLDLLFAIASSEEKEVEKGAPGKVLAIFREKFKGNMEILLKFVAEYRYLQELLYRSVIITGKFHEFSLEMMQFWQHLSEFSSKLGELIVKTAFSRFLEAVELSTGSQTYFSLLEKLYPSFQIYELDALYSGLRSFIESPTKEPSSTSKHSGYAGIFTLFRVTVELKKDKIPKDDVLLVASCLFDMEETAETHSLRPKCKSRQSRLAAFRVLAEMAKKDGEAEELVSAYCQKYHSDLCFRSEKLAAWGRGAGGGERSSGGVGLRNLGATCYLNSVLQALFGVERVREAVLACDQEESADGEMLKQLQRVFVGLGMSDKGSISTKRFCTSYLTLEGTPIPFSVQQDASEFLEELLNKLSLHPPSALCQGQITTVTQGLPPCSHSSRRLESFFCLRLTITGNVPVLSIDQSFGKLVSVEMISGDNAWGCDECGKTPASRATSLSTPPSVLLLTLNRFQYSHDFAQRVKINSFCEFPLVLDLSPYLSDPQHSSLYHLRGVIVHRGMAEAGHYSAFVERAGKWLHFDDGRVVETSFEEVKRSSFGTLENDLENMTESERSLLQNAFILIYECDKKGEKGDFYGISQQISLFQNERRRKNVTFWRKKRIFSEEYHRFISDLLAIPTPLSPYLALQYIFTIGIRSSPLPSSLLQQIYPYLSENREISIYSLSVFSQIAVFSELIVTNPIAIARKLMIAFAVRSYAHSPSQAQAQFVSVVAYFRPRVQETRQCEGYFELVYRLVLCGADLGVVRRLVEIALFPALGLRSADFGQEAASFQSEEFSLGRNNFEIPEKYHSSEVDLSYLSMLLSLSVRNNVHQEVADLLTSSEILYKFVRGTVRKIGARHLFYAVFHVINSSSEEGRIELLKNYVEALRMTVEVEEKAGLKCALMQVKMLISAISDFPQVQSILSQFEFSLSEHLTKYIHPGEETVLFLYKLCKSQPVALQWLLSGSEVRECVEKWLCNYAIFTLENPQNMTLDKVFDQIAYNYPFKPKEKVRKCGEELISANFCEEGRDSDEEFEESDLTQNRFVDIQCTEGTYRAVVIASYENVLRLKYVDYEGEFYLAVDDDQLKNVRN